MRPILAGTETEYGLLVEGRGAEDQIDDSMALVRSYPGECHPAWDYRFESPRADLRGFVLERLAVDPQDARFDRGRSSGPASEVRSDRVLPNGARFYNDHGHPEYATPECLSLYELMLHDAAGERVVLAAARALEEASGRQVTIYKNNTDFHGASYGSHESYLVPREFGFERLFPAVLPMLVARQVLTGAGKVGSEHGPKAAYQISQRADFFAEPANADTLYRRPIFNTRDEPHADPARWIRLHVISGDANMIAEATALKVGLVKLAITLCEAGAAPEWPIARPVAAFARISRDESYNFEVELEGRRRTTVYEILESYFEAAERALPLEEDLRWTVDRSRRLLAELREDFPRFARSVDWAAKRRILEQYAEEEGLEWGDPQLRSVDLEYHNVDPDEGLHAALAGMGEVEPVPAVEELELRLREVREPTRARARGLAVARHRDHLVSASWRALTFRDGDETVTVELRPDATYPAQLGEAGNVGSFVEALRG
jgi:Pup amidohydrolase